MTTSLSLVWWQSPSQSDDTEVVDVIDAELSKSFVMVWTAPWWSPLDKAGGTVAVAVG